MWYVGVFCRGGRGERGSGFRRLCVGMKLGWHFIGSKLGEGATCFSREREIRRGDLRGNLLYEFVMVAL